jgi:hypothetical protein
LRRAEPEVAIAAAIHVRRHADTTPSDAAADPGQSERMVATLDAAFTHVQVFLSID